MGDQAFESVYLVGKLFIDFIEKLTEIICEEDRFVRETDFAANLLVKTDLIPADLELSEQFIERCVSGSFVGVVSYRVQACLEQRIITIIIGIQTTDA
jgi:hypothetical protein